MSAIDKDDLPTVEIKVSKVGSGQVVMHERYQVDPELAKTLAEDLTAVIAQLPESDRRRITKQAIPAFFSGFSRYGKNSQSN